MRSRAGDPISLMILLVRDPKITRSSIRPDDMDCIGCSYFRHCFAHQTVAESISTRVWEKIPSNLGSSGGPCTALLLKMLPFGLHALHELFEAGFAADVFKEGIVL